MLTDKDTQIQILSIALKQIFNEYSIDGTMLMKQIFKTTLTNKFNSYSYPKMNITITHQ